MLYFLPWRTPYRLARLCGLMPLPFAACYETPSHVVSADPVRSVVALREIIVDADAILSDWRHPEPPLLVGFSLGTVAATYLANRFRAPLLSICGAARGEDMIWKSPAAAHIRNAAEDRGYQRTHFYAALDPLNPGANLDNLSPRSVFVIAENDRLVPHDLCRDWARLLHERRPETQVIWRQAGHTEAILMSRRLQRAWHEACA